MESEGVRENLQKERVVGYDWLELQKEGGCVVTRYVVELSLSLKRALDYACQLSIVGTGCIKSWMINSQRWHGQACRYS